MGKIASYHPVFWVKHLDTIYRLDVTCDNWYDDTEVLGKLADLAGAVCMGNIVDAVCMGGVRGGFIMDTQCLKLTQMDQAFAAQDVIDWEMPMGQVVRPRLR